MEFEELYFNLDKSELFAIGCALSLGFLLLLSWWKPRWLVRPLIPGQGKDETNHYVKDGKVVPGLQARDPQSGNLEDIAAAGGFHDFLAGLHNEYGPIASFHFGPKYAVSITTPEYFKQQLKVFDRPPELLALFLSLVGKGSIQYCNGEEGKQRHAAYRRCFSDENVYNFYSIFQKGADELTRQWMSVPQDEHINLRHEMFHFGIQMIVQSAFGSYFEDEEKIRMLREGYDPCWEEMENQLKGSISEPGSARQDQFERCRKLLYDLLDEAAEFHRRQRRENDSQPMLFIDVIDELGLSEDDKRSDMVMMLLAGFHTTGLALTWLFYFLAKDQNIQYKLYKELVETLGDNPVTKDNVSSLRYLQQVLDETLRCSSLVVFASRCQDEETRLGDYTIPANTAVIQALSIAAENPEYFPNPAVFDPERFNAENVASRPRLAFEPFGFAGKRKCPGYKLSQAESKVIISTLVRKFRIDLASDQEVKKVYGLVTSPDQDIWITVSPR